MSNFTAGLFITSKEWIDWITGCIREELSFHVVIVNAWHHECMIPIYSTLMMTPQTAALQRIIGESFKQIMNTIPNKYLVGNIDRLHFNDCGQTSNCSDNSFRTNLAFRLQKWQWHDMLRWKSSCWEKDSHGKRCLYTPGFT